MSTEDAPIQRTNDLRKRDHSASPNDPIPTTQNPSDQAPPSPTPKFLDLPTNYLLKASPSATPPPPLPQITKPLLQTQALPLPKY
ncbi:Protein of unknown function [Gryllus bimaculatus]|nr:Protein of unknown function [Gryllus bimaculatus]